MGTESPAKLGFETIPRNKVYQEVAKQLERHITEELKPGDLLPPERQQDNFVVAKPIKQTSSEAPGTVLAQKPASGKAPQGSTVTLTIAAAPPNVTVPYLRGQKEFVASALLGKLGLTPALVVEYRSTNRP